MKRPIVESGLCGTEFGSVQERDAHNSKHHKVQLDESYKRIKLQSLTMSNRAVALLYGDSGAKGTVWFTQAKHGGPTTIKGEFKGLQPGLHGFHIHQYGDRTNGCTSAGTHFNPHEKTHGGPEDEIRHVGDLGNIEARADGTCSFELEDKLISLQGKHSVIGRSMVVRATGDDLGRGNDEESKTTGNSGACIACGVIGIAADG